MAKKRSKSRKKVKKKYLVEMTSLSVFLWGFCLFFLLAWIFVLGILVGRGFIPGGESAISELKAQIARLQAIVGNSKVRDKMPEKTTDKNPELAFYERLSSKKVEVKNRWQPEKDVVSSREEKETSKIVAFPKNRIEKEDDSPTKIDVAPQGRGTPQVAPTGKQKGQASGRLQILTENAAPEIRYTVQLASLGSRSKAEVMINNLVDRGYPAYYYEADVKGKTYFRVSCGEFNSSKDASRYAEKLTKDTGIKGFVFRVE
jgi:cell division septation protein DedD